MTNQQKQKLPKNKKANCQIGDLDIMSKKYPPQQLQTEATQLHVPVLLTSTLALLQPKIGESYLDLTSGYGGHAAEIVEKTGSASLATLVDRDDNAICCLKDHDKLQGAQLRQQDFASAAATLVKQGSTFDMVLIDLGVSSPQLDNTERGFSFRFDAPLDMRMDQSTGMSAKELVNTIDEQRLSRIIRDYGEERPRTAIRIAQAIIEARPVTTTVELAEVIKTAVRNKGWAKVHPATRTFQALRIAVNDELGQIERVLPLLPQLLKPGGRVAIISFHSLEDRLVKRFFKEETESGYEAKLKLLNKKAISGAIEDVHNPRARSAKLRAAQLK